ncbi:MAG: transposase family protein [Candidatus Symbiodolus clandestinus]
MLSSCEDWQSIEDFGHENQEWFKSFLEFPHGIPSQDTLSRVIGRIDTEAFAELFSTWVREALPSLTDSWPLVTR